MSTYGALITYGRAWFILVTTIVSLNDAAAYFVGVTFGRTPLIRLSPNKTLEGFLGGAVVTVIATFLFASKLFEVEILVCPMTHFTFKPFSLDTCTVPSVYLKREYLLPYGGLFGFTSFMASPA